MTIVGPLTLLVAYLSGNAAVYQWDLFGRGLISQYHVAHETDGCTRYKQMPSVVETVNYDNFVIVANLLILRLFDL